MKTILGFTSCVVVLAVAGCGSGVDESPSRYVMRVDQYVGEPKGLTGNDPIPEASYTQITPRDSYVVVVSGARVQITAVPGIGQVFEMEGVRQDWRQDEVVFQLKPGQYSGGTFVVRDGTAELRIFAENVPIVSSERGTLNDHFTR